MDSRFMFLPSKEIRRGVCGCTSLVGRKAAVTSVAGSELTKGNAGHACYARP